MRIELSYELRGVKTVRQNDGLQICNVVNVLHVAADMMPGGLERAMRGPNATRKQSVNRKNPAAADDGSYLHTILFLCYYRNRCRQQKSHCTHTIFFTQEVTLLQGNVRGCTFSGESKENDRLFLPFLSALLSI